MAEIDEYFPEDLPPEEDPAVAQDEPVVDNEVDWYGAESLDPQEDPAIEADEPQLLNNDIESTEPDPVVPSGVAYDDDGNLLPGYELDENNNPVYVGDGTVATVYGPVPVQPAGVAYDDDGNLLPGYAFDPNGNPVFIGNNYVAPATQASADASRQAALLAQARAQATLQQRYAQATAAGDWRVRLRLAPGANYLYNDPNNRLLSPLRVSNGVIFPYTPQISTNFSANYDKYDLTHSNYRGYFYKNSTVGDISINGTFTAQDTAEAEYLLAVIVFLRSATKMFYGKDEFKGAPPPLVELSGYGQYQFNNHPCLIQSFNYSLPTDVDYIRVTPNNQGINLSNRQARVSSSPVSTIQSILNRLQNAGLARGAQASPGDLGVVNDTVAGLGQSTYVPTKMEIQLTLLPVQTRQQVSQQFSVKNFANGNLLKGGFW